VKIAAIGAPGAVRTMDFTVEPGVNLKPYVEEGSQVDTTATGSRPSGDVTFDGTSGFTVALSLAASAAQPPSVTT
jgi:hypothetical protein